MRAIPSGSAWRTGNALHCEQSLKGLDSQHYEPTYYILSLQNTRRTGSTPRKKNSQQQHMEAWAAVRISYAMRLPHASTSRVPPATTVRTDGVDVVAASCPALMCALCALVQQSCRRPHSSHKQHSTLAACVV